MTEILRAFWKEKRPERIAVLVSGILFAVIFWIYEIPVEIAGYAFLLVILWNVIWFTLVFIRYEKKTKNTGRKSGKNTGQRQEDFRRQKAGKRNVPGIDPAALRRGKKSWNPLCRLKNRSCLIYYSMWVHQIQDSNCSTRCPDPERGRTGRSTGKPESTGTYPKHENGGVPD